MGRDLVQESDEAYRYEYRFKLKQLPPEHVRTLKKLGITSDIYFSVADVTAANFFAYQVYDHQEKMWRKNQSGNLSDPYSI